MNYYLLTSLIWKNIIFVKRNPFSMLSFILVPLGLWSLTAGVAFRKSMYGTNVGEAYDAISLEPFTFVTRLPKMGLHVTYKRPKGDNGTTDLLMKNVHTYMKSVLRSTVVTMERVNSIEIMENIYQQEYATNRDRYSGFIGLDFSVMRNTTPMRLEYVIRRSYDHDRFCMAVDETVTTIMNSSLEYAASGLFFIQRAVELVFIGQVTQAWGVTDNSTILAWIAANDYNLENFPVPGANVIPGAEVVKSLTIFSVVMSTFWLYFTVPLIMVREKQTGIKELMLLMGLKRWKIWISWLILILMTYAIALILVTIVLTQPLIFSPMLKMSPSLLLVFFLLVYAANVAFLFIITTLTSSAKTAAMIATVMLTVQILIMLLTPREDFPIYLRLKCIFPLLAYIQGFFTILQGEEQLKGLTWDDIQTSSPEWSLVGIIPLREVCLFLIIELVVYGVLAWYLDNVIPGKYGVARPWHFLISSRWRKLRDFFGSDDDDEDDTLQSADDLNAEYEPPPSNLKAGIKIKNVYKVYRIGKKLAVNGVTIDIIDSQITVLLGHNGAGKTTLMSIITGMFKATQGTVEIDGHDTKKDMNIIRQSLGLCPQHDMHFPDLTVIDHLVLFAMLKGISLKEAKKDAYELMDKFELGQFANVASDNLSGGWKRKLSLCMAFIGKAKVVILDEPTAGMDPEARRRVWDLLLSMRGSRTILITTHYMDEADVLGDRIAIMDHGKVQCYGTALFLKKKFGAGFRMTLMTRKPCDAKLTEIVRAIVPASSFKGRVGAELTYSLPSQSKDLFPSLFDAIEAKKTEFGIVSIGVSASTLEEVFIRVGEISEAAMIGPSRGLRASTDTISYRDSPPSRIYGNIFCCLQLRALFIKKKLYTQRLWVSILFRTLILLLFAILVFSLAGRTQSTRAADAEMLSMKLYSEREVYISAADDDESQRMAGALQAVVEHSGGSINMINHLLGVAAAFMGRYVQIRENHLHDSEAVVGIDFDLTNTKRPRRVSFNLIPALASPVAVSLIHNALLRSHSGSNQSNIATTIKVLQKDEESKYQITNIAISLWSFLLPIGFLVFTSFLITFPHLERTSHVKQLQYMTGLSRVTFWFSHYVWDLMLYLVVLVIMMILLPICDTNRVFSGPHEIGALALLLVSFGISVQTMAYLFSFMFQNEDWALMAFVFINLLIIMLQQTLSELMPDVVKWMIHWSPFYCLTHGMQLFVVAASARNECNAIEDSVLDEMCNRMKSSPVRSPCCDPFTYYSMEWNHDAPLPHGFGKELLFLLIDFIVYFVVIAILETGIISLIQSHLCGLSPFGKKEEAAEDDDVRKEREDLEHNEGKGMVLVALDLAKRYRCRFHSAVKGVTFGVLPGQCFGLLGTNGAGKTSTFKMLTGDVRPTRGDARVTRFRLKGNRSEYLQEIGYCPQYDPLIEVFTSREMLQLLARLRHVTEKDVNHQVNKIIHRVGLTEYKDRKCGTYSGGNKRKLSTAMAMIGDVPLIFLDEPTAGVDPASRRNMWGVMAAVQKTGCSIVLTSHSMEECEALCNRIAIMVKGRFRCIGEIPYLKHKYGQGFTVVIRLRVVEDNDPRVTQFKLQFEQTYRPCDVKDEYTGYLHYHITKPDLTWTFLFDSMESLKKRFSNIVEDYAISETTLEELFLSFAKKN